MRLANTVQALALTWASDPERFAMGMSELVQDHAWSLADTAPPSQAGAWSAAGRMREPRDRYSLITLNDGRVLAIGGGGDGRSCELYDPRTDSWSETGRMASARTLPTTTLLSDGRVLVTGGLWRNRSAEVYDLTTGSWSPAGLMRSPRYDHAAALLPNGQVLVVGGDDTYGHILATAELWDPATRIFLPIAPLRRTRYGATATTLPNGTVLVAGGFGFGGGFDEEQGVLRSTERWTGGPPLNIGRYWHTATLLPQADEVVVTGGFAGGSVSVTEAYTPGTGVWRTVNALHHSRWWHTATALPDGRLLVTGGTESEGPGRGSILTSTELFDPLTGHWSNGPPMGTGRQSHAAALLPDERVLVAGGVQVSGPLRTAEILRLGRPGLAGTTFPTMPSPDPASLGDARAWTRGERRPTRRVRPISEAWPMGAYSSHRG